jgi:mRNA-degrading endonuclease RelE of RelBE toxin-antitoxin system
MKVEFLKSFSRDLDSISSKSVKQSLVRIIELLEEADDLNKIQNIKKLKGFRNAYRIRIGDYRLGFFLDGSSIQLARFLHRKDIYKIFP